MRLIFSFKNVYAYICEHLPNLFSIFSHRLVFYAVYLLAAFDEQIMMSDDVQFQHWTFLCKCFFCGNVKSLSTECLGIF